RPAAVSTPPPLLLSARASSNRVPNPLLPGEASMSLRISDKAPDFEAETTAGRIRFHEWLGDSWGVLFSHPKDFTPICTTELGYMARIKPEFDKRGVKIIGLSVDPVDRHAKWAEDIEETQGFAPNARQSQGREAGELEAGRRCRHRGLGER